MTSSTRDKEMPLVRAPMRRCARPVRPGCIAPASSSAPTSLSGAASSTYRFPLTVAVPAVGRSRPITIRIVVDLPAPFGPRKPVTFPASTSNVRSSTARTSP